MSKWKQPSRVRAFWVGNAYLYQTKSKEKIATVTMSSIGCIIAWHEFVPRKIAQRLPIIWSSHEAAQHAIFAAHAEALQEKAK